MCVYSIKEGKFANVKLTFTFFEQYYHNIELCRKSDDSEKNKFFLKHILARAESKVNKMPRKKFIK